MGARAPAALEAIYLAPAAGRPMQSVAGATLGRQGLEGDRYLTGRGYYSPFDVCEVTLVAGEALDAIRSGRGIDLSDGRHRRNVVVRRGQGSEEGTFETRSERIRCPVPGDKATQAYEIAPHIFHLAHHSAQKCRLQTVRRDSGTQRRGQTSAEKEVHSAPRRPGKRKNRTKIKKRPVCRTRFFINMSTHSIIKSPPSRA